MIYPEGGLAIATTLLLSCAFSLADVSLSDDDKSYMVKLHNDARDIEPASDMKHVAWDPNLASEAQKWTDGCSFVHQTGPSWGENLSAVGYSSSQPMNAAMDRLFQLWVKEKQYNVDGTFEECCSQTSGKCCHYTQVIWAKTVKVGCGLTVCPTLTSNFGDMNNMLYLACYYSPSGNKPIVTYTFDWRPYQPTD